MNETHQTREDIQIAKDLDTLQKETRKPSQNFILIAVMSAFMTLGSIYQIIAPHLLAAIATNIATVTILVTYDIWDRNRTITKLHKRMHEKLENENI